MGVAIEIIGWAGAIALLTGYYLISTKKVDQDHHMYIALNIFGAFALFINTLVHKAYPSVVTNFLWTLIGIFTAYRVFFRVKPAELAQIH